VDFHQASEIFVKKVGIISNFLKQNILRFCGLQQQQIEVPLGKGLHSKFASFFFFV